MTTGDEPQLGGQALDHAPMISGRGTRIIVSARGAYVAGNIDALIGKLNQEQQKRFRRAVIEQALAYGDKVANYEVMRVVLREIRQWLADADEARMLYLELLLQSYEERGDLSDDEYLTSRVAERIFQCAIESNLAQAVRYSMEAARYHADVMLIRQGEWNPRGIYPSVGRAIWLARRWQIEAAWALLQGRGIPPLDESASDEMRKAYRAGDLPALIGQMTPEQRNRFKETLIGTALQFARRVMLSSHDRGEGHCFNLAERYLHEPLAQNSTALKKCRRANQHYRSLLSPKERSDQLSIHPAVHCLEALIAPGFDRTAESTHYAVIGACDKLRGGLDWLNDNPFEWWQVETVWAILHGESIPPYEFDKERALR